jgi:hypothetical protein
MSDESIEYHAARVLVLVDAMAPRGGPVDGLTKLVKLDFLLRYPQFLDRLLQSDRIAWPEGLEPTEAERLAVDSPMIRYKYGPWDDRYYPILGYLVGTGLAVVERERGAMSVRLSDEGRRLAKTLAADAAWRKIASRAALLRDHFNLTGNALKERIYKDLPEVVDRAHRTRI